ncbi:putative Conjugal transfer protein TrbL [Brevibacillus sp. IT-7CA2]|uniref:hypothetical protein n=1 Tax=Brevibacillus sp. IT-7CA2 TaxID=3026436 RepID=UPI0039DF43F0
MKRHRFLLFIICLLILTGCATNNSALDNPVTPSPSQNDSLPEYEEPGTFEKMIADFVVAIPNFIVRFLGLKDINELVFGLKQESNLVYGLIPSAMWEGISNIFSIQGELIGYLLVLALSAWVFLIVFQAGSPASQMTARDMTTGFLIFMGSMYFGSYIFQMIFGLNTFLIRFGYTIVSAFFQEMSIGQVTDVGFFNALAYSLGIVDMSGVAAMSGTAGGVAGAYFAMTTGAAVLPYAAAGVGIGMALVLVVAVCFVAVFNFQYVNRMVGIASHIAFFPAVAYSSIFPASRNAFSIWLNSILSLTLSQGFQAMFLAFLYPAIFNNGSFVSKVILLFVLIAGLIGIPALVTMVLGSPGGAVSSAFGLNAYVGLGQITKVMRGGNGGGNNSKPPVMDSNLATSSNKSSTPPPSVGQAGGAKGFLPNMESLMNVSKGVKAAGQNAVHAAPKALAYSGAGLVAGVGIATVAGAASMLTGNMGAGIGVANAAMGASRHAARGKGRVSSNTPSTPSQTVPVPSSSESYSSSGQNVTNGQRAAAPIDASYNQQPLKPNVPLDQTQNTRQGNIPLSNTQTAQSNRVPTHTPSHTVPPDLSAPPIKPTLSGPASTDTVRNNNDAVLGKYDTSSTGQEINTSPAISNTTLQIQPSVSAQRNNSVPSTDVQPKTNNVSQPSPVQNDLKPLKPDQPYKTNQSMNLNTIQPPENR